MTDIMSEVAEHLYDDKPSQKKLGVGDNVIYINPVVKRFHEEIKDCSFSYERIFEIYAGWFETLYFLTFVNEGRVFKNHKLREHIEEVFDICQTLSELSETAD